MSVSTILAMLVIGAIAGWLAGKIMQGQGFGLLGNIAVGIVGSLLGGLVFGMLGFASIGIIGSIISATVGAVLLLYIIQKVKS
ncbi:GlsB/YeaQ/YmgE family stress response membrane protein [Shewanella sp. SNU WT4]|uniref:GlsB/YeaQ/YmgE family stress response membrane protein n=1 Tax=Shewanella sp. SNU WT4 TaxID=2590015 RepID=UPI00112D2872|nr:GlsB/YeaQ/YmgE family stress response membrane protein [Shewanella sp. SNU WT4]QDF68085.1 GlsB/YeaQ/YmgE family stress response membrane protein [Shewanella sp. SNU WT4]